MTSAKHTLADLAAARSAPLTARDCLAGIVRKKVLSGEDLFPGIFGIEMQKRRVVEVLMTGKGVLLTGEYGVAKTDLAKHVLGLLNESCSDTEILYVERCPVQEDPYVLLHYARNGGRAGNFAAAEPCPICKKLLSDARGDLSMVAVERLEKLTEGRGFARVQGGGDVLPEEIIGTYNLIKLAQIGDPFDPRVFEAGKIGQSSRGLLFVDEMGKLPETAQHALIQAAQESIVTPAKSRETFPVDFLLMATTNPVDEEYICGAVRDRLVSIEIPLVDMDDEMRIVDREVRHAGPGIYMPRLFLKLAVEVVRALRAEAHLTLGPRTSINAGLIGRSSAMLEGRCIVSFCNIKEGIYTAILGKAAFEDKADVEHAINAAFPGIAEYLERNLGDVSIAEAVKRGREQWGDKTPWQAAEIKRFITAGACPTEIDRLAGWIYHNETAPRFMLHEILAEYLGAFVRGCDAGDRLQHNI